MIYDLWYMINGIWYVICDYMWYNMIYDIWWYMIYAMLSYVIAWYGMLCYIYIYIQYIQSMYVISGWAYINVTPSRHIDVLQPAEWAQSTQSGRTIYAERVVQNFAERTVRSNLQGDHQRWTWWTNQPPYEYTWSVPGPIMLISTESISLCQITLVTCTLDIFRSSIKTTQQHPK